MRKIISFLILLFITALVTFGQQDPQYTNNMFYKLGVNPGFAGSDDAISGIILNRYQWTGLPGAPKTLVFSADAAVDLFGAPGGVGINIISDELGFEENVLVNFSYAYKATLSIGVLGIGASAGFFSKSINGDWYVPDDEMGLYTPPGSDPSIPMGEASQIAFDAGLGVYLKAVKYYLGLSVTHVNQAAIKYADLASVHMKRHYYLTGGYNIRLSDPLFELRPSVLVKSDLAGWQIDINTNLVYNDRLWAGITYRPQDAVALLMGLELMNGLKAGYSFDLTTSALARYGYGSHELFLGYSLDLGRNRNRKYKSVRFL
jgi:type IX secretion system PorP/SprF family membrane protein